MAELVAEVLVIPRVQAQVEAVADMAATEEMALNVLAEAVADMAATEEMAQHQVLQIIVAQAEAVADMVATAGKVAMDTTTLVAVVAVAMAKQAMAGLAVITAHLERMEE